jgi:uncharacterized membrane protein YcaP (DUF421 family)
VADWQAMFDVDVPVLELRGSLTFLMLLVLMRVVGQRESGGLGLTDVLVVVLAVDAAGAGAGLTGGAGSITEGFVLVATVLFWSVAVDAVAHRWPRFAALVKARPRPLIDDGRLNRRAMRREFMSEDEVLSQLRLHGVADPAEVHRAYLEPNGLISIIRRDGTEPDAPQTPAP